MLLRILIKVRLMLNIKFIKKLIMIFDNDFTLDKSTSSTVQKEASAFLYMCQISGNSIGKITNRFMFSFNNGSISLLKTFLLIFSLFESFKKDILSLSPFW